MMTSGNTLLNKRSFPAAGAICYLFATLCLVGIAGAAPEEIQVYMDDMDAPGKFGLDLHLNYTFSGSKSAPYPGGQAPDHVFRFTAEPSFGLTEHLELGGYIITSIDSSGADLDGEKIRLKYIATEPNADQGQFYGANFEIGFVRKRFEENPVNAELKGIYGFRSGPWTFAINPNLDWTVAGSHPDPVTLEIDTKVSYAIFKETAIGFESYNGFGPLSRLGHFGNQIQELYAVLDTTIYGFDLNIGLGRGFTDASDRWVLKAIIGVPLGK